MNIFITFIAAGAAGLLFYRLKVPGGMMIGAVCATVLLSLTFRCAAMPYAAKFAAQITAGAFIGCSVDREDLLQLKAVYRPALAVIGSFGILNLLLGFLLHHLFPMEPLTALLCAVPGGMSDLPLTAADMGADVSQVVILQFVRLCAGIGLFPSWILWLDRKNASPVAFGEPPVQKSVVKKKKPSPPAQITAVLFVASLSGIIGRRLGIPAGALIFSMMGSLALKITVLPVVLPRRIKQLAQVLSGAYIGCTIGVDSLKSFPSLLLPAVTVVLAYMLNALLTSRLLSRWFSLPFREAMLMVTPAGASDMALISADIGVQSPVLVVVQILRMLTAASIFPQVCYQIARLIG